MDIKAILSKTDHTILTTTATIEEVSKVCQEAVQFGAASACIPPCYVRQMRQDYKGIAICTVIGFPNGYSTTQAKIYETADAISNGATEIDMVVNLAAIKNKDFDSVAEEVAVLKEICAKRVLKVIVETCCLTEEEKITMCKIVTDSGADFIKTSTGFASSGAALQDIKLFRQHLGKDVKIKASGGIRTLQQAADFILAGSDRIGASALIKCAKEGLL